MDKVWNKNRELIVITVVAIMMVTTFLRLYPILQFSAAPASYSGLGVSDYNYLIKTGHAIPSGRGEVLLDKLSAMEAIVVDIPTRDSQLITPLFLGLVIVLIFFMFYNSISNESYSLASVVSIALFATSATPDIIIRLTGWNDAYTWIFMLTSLYLLLRKVAKVEAYIICMILMFAIPATYFTDSLIFGFILTTVVVIQLILKRNIIPRGMVLLYIIFMATWLLYMSRYGFSTIVNVIPMIGNFLHGSSRVMLLSNIAHSSPLLFIRDAIPAIIAAIPAAYLLIFCRKRIDGRLYLAVLGIYIAIVAMTAGFYAWMGITGVFQRIPLYVDLFSILCYVIIIASRIDKKLKILLNIIVMCAIVFSYYAYITSPYIASNYITYAEDNGANWLMQHASMTSPVFTDMLLSGPFVAASYSTIGINDVAMPPDKVNTLLDELFYNVHPVQALGQLGIGGQGIRYLFFTSRYCDPFPGIKGYDYNYKPANPGYISMYDSIPDFDSVFVNSNITVFWVKT